MIQSPKSAVQKPTQKLIKFRLEPPILSSFGWKNQASYTSSQVRRGCLNFFRLMPPQQKSIQITLDCIYEVKVSMKKLPHQSDV